MYKIFKMTPLMVALSSISVWAQNDRDTTTTHQATDVAHINAHSEYTPDAMYHNKQTEYLTQSKLHSQKMMFLSSEEGAETTCPTEAFSQLSGSVFLNAIKDYGRECINNLFNDKPETLTLGAYTNANFNTVINELKTQLHSYDGQTNAAYLSNLFYWLKAYAYYDHRRFINPVTQQAMTQAINTLYANSHFFDKTPNHAKLVRSATGIIKNAQIGQFLVPMTLGLLARYDESYEKINDWGRSATPLFWQVLNDCSKTLSSITTL